MNKQEFLGELGRRLCGLPSEEIEQRLEFYSEMIDDKIEEGAEEEEAVSALGDVSEIAAQIKADVPLAKLVKEKIKPKKKLSALEIVLIVLGSPIWISLLLAALAVVFAVYVVIWSVVISLWAVFVSLVASTLVSLSQAVVFVCWGHADYGIFMLGAGLILAGVAVFAFFGCRLVTKGVVLLTKKIFIGIKNCFMKKGGSVNE